MGRMIPLYDIPHRECANVALVFLLLSSTVNGIMVICRSGTTITLAFRKSDKFGRNRWFLCRIQHCRFWQEQKMSAWRVWECIACVATQWKWYAIQLIRGHTERERSKTFLQRYQCLTSEIILVQCAVGCDSIRISRTWLLGKGERATGGLVWITMPNRLLSSLPLAMPERMLRHSEKTENPGGHPALAHETIARKKQKNEYNRAAQKKRTHTRIIYDSNTRQLRPKRRYKYAPFFFFQLFFLWVLVELLPRHLNNSSRFLIGFGWSKYTDIQSHTFWLRSSA